MQEHGVQDRAPQGANIGFSHNGHHPKPEEIASAWSCQKRDGSVVPFDCNKIRAALRKCCDDVKPPHVDRDALVEDVTRAVVNTLAAQKKTTPEVEEVQRLVIQQLWAKGLFELAEGYQNYREERRKARQRRPVAPEVAQRVLDDQKHFATDLQYYQFMSKFSRWRETDKRRETWKEACFERVLPWLFKQPLVKGKLSEQEMDELGRAMYDLEAHPAMRVLQMAGPALDRCNVGAYNCLARDTEFITRDGVKSFNDFKDGDRTLVLTHTGAWRMATVRCYGTDTVYPVTFERGLTRHTVYATANHRWIHRDGHVSNGVKEGDLIWKAPGDAHNSHFRVLKTDSEGVVTDVWCLEVDKDQSFVLPTGIVTGNCAYQPICDLFSFPEMLYILMQGTGAGFSCESDYVAELPRIKKQRGGKKETVVVGDSTEEWCDSYHRGLQLWFDGYDCWFDVRGVRKKNMPLKTKGGRSSGPEPFLELMTFARNMILARQGKFLDDTDVHRLCCFTGRIVQVGGVRRAAEISLSDLLSHGMRHLKHGQWYADNLFWENGKYLSMANNSAVYEEYPDVEVFVAEMLALIQSKSGERGIFNREGAINGRPARRKPAKFGCNPCVTADTWVHTDRGAYQVKHLINTPFGAMVDGKVYTSNGFFKTGVKPVKKVRLHGGVEFRATANHKVLVVSHQTAKAQRTEWKEVGELTTSDRVVLHDHRGAWWQGAGNLEEGWLLGNLLGDGDIQADGQANLDFWGPDCFAMQEIAVARVHRAVGGRSDLVGSQVSGLKVRVQSANLGRLAKQYGMTNGNKTVTPQVEGASAEFCVGFLRGYFDADGSVQGPTAKGVSVRLTSVSVDDLKAVQRMLARFGVISNVYQDRHPAGPQLMPDGEGGLAVYECQARHELVIANDNIGVFAERIGFDAPTKRTQLAAVLQSYKRSLNRERFCAEVVAVEDDGVEAVYDCTVPGPAAFDANGAYVHNCAEIILRPHQFCVSGDTPLITRDHAGRIGNMVGKEVEVWNGKRWSKVTVRKTGTAQQLVRVKFSDGSHLDCTPDHRFSVNTADSRYGHGEDAWNEVEAKDLRNRMATETFSIQHTGGVTMSDPYRLGVLIGDGYEYGDGTLAVDLYGEKISLPIPGERGEERIKPGYNVPCVTVRCGNHGYELFRSLRTDDETSWFSLFSATRDSILKFLAGWFDADGSNTDSGGVRLYVSGKYKADMVQLLLTKCGVRSSVNRMAKVGDETNFGPRKSATWYVQVTDCADLPCHRLDTSSGHKATAKGKYQTVVSVEYLPGRHDTFCFTEPEQHKGVFNNTLTFQCNLTMAIARKDDTVESLKRKVRLATLFGVIQSTCTDFKYIRPEWKKNCDEERLLGVDITGQADCPLLQYGAPGRAQLLNTLKGVVAETRRQYARRFGINDSAADTCVKPGGDSAIFFDCGSGISDRFADQQIRWVREKKGTPVANFLVDAGVPHAEAPEDKELLVFGFPKEAPEGSTTRNAHTALQQLEMWLETKKEWAEHSVSVTIYVEPHEWPAVIAWCYEPEHWKHITGISFLPKDNGTYTYAPNEELSPEAYQEFKAKFPKLNWAKLQEYEDEDMTTVSGTFACTGGGCM